MSWLILQLGLTFEQQKEQLALQFEWEELKGTNGQGGETAAWVGKAACIGEKNAAGV